MDTRTGGLKAMKVFCPACGSSRVWGMVKGLDTLLCPNQNCTARKGDEAK